MSILEIAREGANAGYLKYSLAFEAAVLIDHEFGTSFEAATVFVAVLEGVDAIIVAHLICLPHTDVLVPIGEGHFAPS